MRLAVAFALLAVTGAAAHASVAHDSDVLQTKERHARKEEQAGAAHNLLRGRPTRHRQLQADPAAQPAETKWDNNRISESNPDGLPLDPATGKPDCWPSCYSHHYDGAVDVGAAEVDRAVGGVPHPAEDAVEQAALQLALAEAEAAVATRAQQQQQQHPNPHIVYDYSTGHKYDLSTGQKIVVEEIEHANVNTGQENVDVKVYLVEGLPVGGALDDPTPSHNNSGGNGGADSAAALPLDDPTPSTTATCTKARDDETCAGHSECESGCCAALATKVKCVEPRLPIFKQYCPVSNPCRDDAESAGTMVPKEATEPASQSQPTKPTYVHSAYPHPGGGDSDDGETDTGGTLYTVGTFTTSGADPSGDPSNPNRVVGGTGGTTAGQGANGSGIAAAADCTVDKEDDWPIGKVPTQNQCEASCQCRSGCCVKYWFQICVDKTANEGRWADKCI